MLKGSFFKNVEEVEEVEEVELLICLVVIKFVKSQQRSAQLPQQRSAQLFMPFEDIGDSKKDITFAGYFRQ
jgi:hypothetical protein